MGRNLRTIFTGAPALLSAIWIGACLGCASAPEPKTPKSYGGAYQGALRLEPDPARLPTAVNGCVEELALRASNTGAAPVTIREFVAPNGALGLSSPLPTTIGPGAQATLALRFAPVTAGDWSGTLTLSTDEEGAGPYSLQTVARSEQKPFDQRRPVAPLDLVFVLDVSTTMNEMASLRASMQELFSFIEANSLDVRFGLTTFENDVIVHRGGAFLGREGFFRELDSQLVEGTWLPNPNAPRQLINYDFPENSLDALHRSATEFAFRPGSRRYLVLMTDDTFLEAPLRFSDGTPALHSYSEVADALTESEIRLFSVHASDKGRGLSAPYKGQDSLVESSGGSWFELTSVDTGTLTLEALLSDLVVGPGCN